MKILLTGGSGFIGSNFVRVVLRDHPELSILNLDALTYSGNPENLSDVEVLDLMAYLKSLEQVPMPPIVEQ